jgi:two-component sensor histidine kinase
MASSTSVLGYPVVQIQATPLIPVASTFITDQLDGRAAGRPDYLREKLAMQDLAQHMSDEPAQVLPRLVQLAMELCGADSAGVSVLEPATKEFRWFGLKGVLSTFEGAHTPRHNSPCGLCLDMDGPILMDRPERAYDWIRDADISVPEVLLVPLHKKGLDAMGTLWLVSEQRGHFTRAHAEMMTDLSAFAATALRMIQTDDQLTAALQEQEVLTREMSHRVKNLFTLMSSMVRMTRRGAKSADDFADKLTGRIAALADANALVRRQFAEGAAASTDFGDIVRRILVPYGFAKASVTGPVLPVGERSTNSVALIFHELATNAAKYGALSNESGTIAVDWTADEKDIALSWKEVGGPVTTPPANNGFGSRLIAMTVQGAGGSIEYEWKPDGLNAHLRMPLSALKT